MAILSQAGPSASAMRLSLEVAWEGSWGVIVGMGGQVVKLGGGIYSNNLGGLWGHIF